MTPRLRKQKERPIDALIHRSKIHELIAASAYRQTVPDHAPDWIHVRGALRARFMNEVDDELVTALYALTYQAVQDDRDWR